MLVKYNGITIHPMIPYIGVDSTARLACWTRKSFAIPTTLAAVQEGSAATPKLKKECSTGNLAKQTSAASGRAQAAAGAGDGRPTGSVTDAQV